MGGEYMNTLYFQSCCIIYETIAPYSPQQNGISEKKYRVLKEMITSMLSYLGLSQGFWGEAMLTAFYLLNNVPNKRKMIILYELWTKRKPNLNYLKVWGCMVVVKLLDPKIKTLVSINSIIESRDEIFEENRFSLVPRPSLRIPNGTKDIGGSVVPQEVTEEVVTQQPESELRKGKRNRTPKNFGPKFQLYLIEGTRNEKEEINDEMDSIMGNNTWVLADLSPCCKPLGFKWIFKRKLKTKEFLSLRFSMKDIGEADVILVSTSIDTCKKQMPSNGQAVSQLEYSRVIGCRMHAMTCTRPDIAFAVGKLSRYNSYPVIESELMALATAGKEAEWLRNMILEILLWSKPIAPISIRCDSAATLTKAYSQMYNEKSRHLGVRNSMIHELITNGVVSIEFVRSQKNLTDHLTKGLTRGLVLKSAEGMGLKSN
uniref:Zinc finger, CCHC-type n=1 Tax=Tanacetum cinerariifolium TaxID=118510 RepID=A0A699IL65_TANCI|nr:zinc finger, CCHC-type [Tanacetum cinerariifolium]